ncbi:HEAT repeat domain-containing protein [Maribellus maritimus]|uniref:HEAT repeat domain-containing protein n=1 Tax=Maribellus maritimus TaxID=2870838 RepID=UPI001EEA3C5B|nr:HEAT repeat domain-containing protein [Maribellus maritimus]MCG6191488.1 HEAT repeat domain-containing protein [Maribellus maritimus]
MKRKDWTDEKLFERLLTNRTKKTYWENIRELRRRPNQYVFDRTVGLIKTNSDKEIIIGIDILAQLGFNPRFKQNEIVEICFSLLEKEQTPKVLESVLFAISHNNEILREDQILILIKLKTHRYCIVRYGLVQALSGLEQKDAIETLIELSTDKDPDIRDWATFSLGAQIETNTDSITKLLWKQINDSSELVRFEAIAGLAKRQDKRIKDILIQELKKIDDNGSIILESIEVFNDFDFIELLEKQIELNKKTQQVNEKWLIDTLGKLKTKAQDRSLEVE